MKKLISAIVLLTAALPILLCSFFACCFPVYDNSYYAALQKQYDRLTGVKEQKVVLVGGSNVAFGTDCELFESLYHKPLVNVGLYGVFGTKMMMELSKKGLRAGDIVVLAPELSAEAYSTECNYTALWKASETEKKLLFSGSFDSYGKVLASMLPYAFEKREYVFRQEKPENEGIYSYDAVNDFGEIQKGLRSGNRMRTGCLDEELLLDKATIDGDFIDFVNNYADECRLRGITVYFSFSPINRKALEKQNGTQEDLYEIYDYLRENLSCPILSDPNDYAFDYRYFYDTNFHLNDAGAVLRTVQLVRDLKAQTGDSSAMTVSLPEPPDPQVYQPDIDETLPYTDASLFEYASDGEDLVIVGVKEEAKSLDKVVLPVRYQGKYIVNVAAGAFEGCRWKRVEVPVGITELSSGAFKGCSQLSEIALYESNGKNISVYDSTFNGVASDCKILLLRASRNEFLNGDGLYFWQRVTLPIEEALS